MKAVAILALALVFLIPACEGDQGPAGPQGTQGPEGPAGAPGTGYTNTPSPGFGTGLTMNDVTTVTFEITETSSMVFFMATDNVWGPGTPCQAAIRLAFDGAPDDLTLVMADNHIAISGNNKVSMSTSAMKSFNQGTHTVTLQRGGCSFDKHPHLNVIVLSN